MPLIKIMRFGVTMFLVHVVFFCHFCYGIIKQSVPCAVGSIWINPLCVPALHTVRFSLLSFTVKLSGMIPCVWAVFCLFLETFLHLALLLVIDPTALPDLRLLPSELKQMSPPLAHVTLFIVLGVSITIPFAYYGIFNLIGGFVVPFTIAILFEIFSFLYIGLLAVFHRSHLGLRPHLMLSIELFTALPIHTFCAFFFAHYLRFAVFYQESLKLNVEFTHQVEQWNYALKLQRVKKLAKMTSKTKGMFQ